MALPSEDIQHSLQTSNEEFTNWKSSVLEQQRGILAVISVFGLYIGFGAKYLSEFEWNERNILLMKIIVITILVYNASYFVMLRQTIYRKTNFGAFVHNISLFIGSLAYVLELLVLFPAIGWGAFVLWGIFLVCYLIVKLIYSKHSVMGGINTTLSNNEDASHATDLLTQNLNISDESHASAADPSELEQNHNSLEEHVVSIPDDVPDDISYT